MKYYIFKDVETTGLLKAESSPLGLQPYVTELCMIKTDEDLNIVDEYNQLFKVPNKLEDKVIQITGITDEMLADKMPFARHWREVADFCLGVTRFVAHNASFDRDCIRYELMRLGKQYNFPWPPELVCTIEKSMHFKGHRLSLGKLHEHLFGEKFEGAHRAKQDVEAMIRCYRKMRELANG